MLVSRAVSAHPWSPRKIAIFSGLSDPSTCALSKAQRDFLDALEAPASTKVFRNFPWIDAEEVRAEPPLLRASWQNVRQYLGAKKPTFVTQARRHWRALRESTDTRLILALSCGLEILRHLLDEHDDPATLTILALGPVTRAWPVFPCTLLYGSRDPIARMFSPQRSANLTSRVITIPAVGHLDYFRSADVLRIANELLWVNTSNSSAAASISRTAS
jgi:hypothetical protein